ncbi:MAG: peptidase S11 [Betaproteobacteria bacterium]|nr:peptidase S11 [Betaproteobacteria bacterium]
MGVKKSLHCGLLALVMSALLLGATAHATEAAKGSRQQASSSKSVKAQKVKAPKARREAVKRDPRNRMSAKSKLGVQSAMTTAALSSSAALVVDQISGEVLFEKNPNTVLPIASITKLMTALVVAEADLPMDEMLTVTQEDADLEKGVKSRLAVGTRLTRGEFMHLALMSSENRAAHLLGRNYPGGLDAFVAAMNIKAKHLGMTDSRFVEPTGLSASNVSSPRDLVRLVEESHRVEEIREYSTARKLNIRVRGRDTQFINTNALARGDQWDLGVSKTGFIREAGRCLVMQAEVDRRPVIMIMLDASGKEQRLRDAERLRRWIIQQADQAPRSNPSA